MMGSSLTVDYLSRVRFSQETVALLGEVQAHRGKQDLYQDTVPEKLKELRESAIIQSAESSNRLERIVVAPARLTPVLNEETPPSTRQEGELLGYKRVLETIHQHHEILLPTPNFILQIHRDLMQFSQHPGGEWKRSPNNIEAKHPDGRVEIRFQTIPPYLVPQSMDALFQNYRSIQLHETTDRLVVIAGYVLDFLCIHPFGDGNGRTARLLTLLLLYKAGFNVGQYVSLERLIEQTKDGYYDALGRSDDNWHTNQHNLEPWLRYLASILLAAYRELASDVGKVDRPNLTQKVLDTVAGLENRFTSAQVIMALPHETPQSIRNILQLLRQREHIDSHGAGKGAYWTKRL